MSPAYLTPFPADALPERLRAAIAELEPQFDVDLHAVTKQMLWEYNEGLNKRVTADNADTFLPMIPTFVHDVPDGSETGKFLALDLGGTNLRVCEVTLLGGGKFDIEQSKFPVSDELKKGTAEALFDHIATAVGEFVVKHGSHLGGAPVDLAFTFSFPVEQTALDRGTLISWTKGFAASGAIGQDVPGLLQAALDRKQVPVRVVALVNDTVGTLLSGAYQSGSALAGAIFGTGTNGAFLVPMKQIGKFSEAERATFPSMIINTEWGAFDNERVVLKFTQYDNVVDRTSINPRRQAFEKSISGMYLGEVTRVVLLSLIDRELLFKGRSTPALNKHYGLDTELMSLIEAHPIDGSANDRASIQSIREVLVNKLGLADSLVTDADAIACHRVSEIVGTRGARLSACAVAATVQQAEVPKGKTTRFAVDGSVVAFYPGFEERLRDALKTLLGEQERDIEIGIAKDGSGAGAALCALMAKKQRESGSKLQAAPTKPVQASAQAGL